MRLSEVEAFDAVMRTGNTVRAAEFLGISQPAISRAITRLSESTRLRLFKTVKGRLVPTPEARLLHEEVRRVFVGLDRLRVHAASLREFGGGALRIAAYPALGLSFVPRAIRSFRKSMPAATVTLHVVGSHAARELVSKGQVDLALSADEIDTTHVDASVFMTPRAVVVMREDNPLAKVRVINVEHLVGQDYLALSPDDTVQLRLNRLCAERGIDLRTVVQTQYSETVCNLAREGIGVGLANSASVLASGFGDRGLIVRPFEPELSFRALLLYPKDRVRSSMADEFVRAMYRVRNKAGYQP